MIRFAHRGSCIEFPENSRAGVRFALDKDVDWIEIDIHVTKDGRFVAFHDHTLFFKTGVARLTRRTEWSGLQGLRLRHKGQPTRETIPEALELIKLITKTKTALLDIKFDFDTSSVRRFADEVVSQVDAGRVIFGFQFLRSLRLFSEWAPKVRKACMITPTSLQRLFIDKSSTKCDFLLINRLACHHIVVDQARAEGVGVLLTTPSSRPVKLEGRARRFRLDGYAVNL